MRLTGEDKRPEATVPWGVGGGCWLDPHLKKGVGGKARCCVRRTPEGQAEPQKRGQQAQVRELRTCPRAGQSGSYKAHRLESSGLLQEDAVGGGPGEESGDGAARCLGEVRGPCRGGPGVLAGGAAP